MVRIQIGDAERDINNVDENWIIQQINRRRSDGLEVCVRVVVNSGELNMVLSTPTSGGQSRGGRAPYPHEKVIFDLWNHRGLNTMNFNGGNVMAFLKQLRRYL